MFARFLSLTRFTIYIPIIGAWIAALFSLGLGGYEVLYAILLLVSGAGETGIKQLVINLIEGVDLFLLGTAFYIISLGLYELFINDNAPLPPWLVIHDLDDLKNKLLKVIVVVLSVQFMAQALNWKGGLDLLGFGAAVAVVILAVAVFIGQKGHSNGAGNGHSSNRGSEEQS